MNLEKQFFRKQALGRISSPEELRAYMRVTSPKLWMILIAIAVLLVGFIAYAATARMETTMDMTVSVHQQTYTEENGSTYYGYIITGSLSDSAYGTVQRDMTVRIGDFEGTISSVSDLVDGTLLIVVNLEYDETAVLPNGDYTAQIVLETTTPLSFLLN